MVVHSTLRYHQDKPVRPAYSTADTASASMHPEAHVADNTQTASMLHPGGAALPTGPLFGNVLFDRNHLNPWGNDDIPAPTDGNKVWFCSNCSDGPHGAWQNICVNCHHPRCHKCTWEETA